MGNKNSHSAKGAPIHVLLTHWNGKSYYFTRIADAAKFAGLTSAWLGVKMASGEDVGPYEVTIVREDGTLVDPSKSEES